MRAVVCLVSSLVVTRGDRVVNVNDYAEVLEVGEVSEHKLSEEQYEELDSWDEDEEGAMFKKWERINAGDMQKRFSSGDEAMLMPGETVELAWKQGKFDVLCFTNLRFFEADGKASFGKVQKTKYTSGLWRTLGSWSAETIGGGMDRDVELTMHDAYVNPPICPEPPCSWSPMVSGNWEFDFNKKEDIMEINKFVEKKVMEAKAWQQSNKIGLQKAKSVMFAQNSKHQIPNGMSKLKAISNDQGAKVLAKDGPFMIDGEKLLYSFTETRWSRDHIYLTNKRAILADRKMGSKKKNSLRQCAA